MCHGEKSARYNAILGKVIFQDHDGLSRMCRGSNARRLSSDVWSSPRIAIDRVFTIYIYIGTRVLQVQSVCFVMFSVLF